MEQGLEDRELGLQGGGLLGAEGGAVGSVGGLEGSAVLEGGEADAAAGGHPGGGLEKKCQWGGATDLVG